MRNYLPTSKTIAAKVREAIEALDSGKYAAIANKHVSADMEELGFDSAEEYWDAIYGFLHEIQDADTVKCYVGGRPPQRSYERGFQGLELFAYAWDSPSTNRRMYLKFGIRNETYYHLDCHEDRPKH